MRAADHGVETEDKGGERISGDALDNDENTVETGHKVCLMSGSGQSKEDRQELRRRQREPKEQIVGITDDAVEEVNECREENNRVSKEGEVCRRSKVRLRYV